MKSTHTTSTSEDIEGLNRLVLRQLQENVRYYDWLYRLWGTDEAHHQKPETNPNRYARVSQVEAKEASAIYRGVRDQLVRVLLLMSNDFRTNLGD
jgi:hypothetical protein